MNTAPHPNSPILGPHFPMALALASALVSVYLFATYEGELTLENQLLALLIAHVAFLPTILYFSGGNRSDFPVFELLMGWYSVSLGWSSLFPELDWRMVHQEHIGATYEIALAGLLAALAGFYLLPQLPRIRFAGRAFKFNVPQDFLYITGMSFIGLNVALFALTGVIQAGSLEIIRVTLGNCGICLAWLYYFKPNIPPNRKLMILGATATMLLVQALVASVKPLIVPLIVIGFAYWRVHHRVPFKLIFCVVLAFLILNPVKFYWRERVAFGSGSQVLSVWGNLSALQEAFTDYYFGSNVRNIEGTKLTLNRLSDIAIFSKAVSWTPEYVPYWEGETLKALPYTFIPRFLWPGKPRALHANQFGQRYELIGPKDTKTLISTAWITELYVNFGSIGVLLGMGMIGVMARWVQDSFGARGVTDLHFAVGVGAAGPLYNAGENLAMIWGGLPLKVIVLLVMINALHSYLYGGRQARNSTRSPASPA